MTTKPTRKTVSTAEEPGIDEARRSLRRTGSGRRPSCDANVEAVREQLRTRAALGLNKYGVTTERADLRRVDWLRHAQEEALDLAVYLEAEIQIELKAASSTTDPKLSDSGAWRGSCEGRAKKAATDVSQRPARTRRLRTGKAATVTRAAVRCSARLGFFVAAEPAWQRLRKVIRFADDRRIGGLGKWAITERMEVTRDESSRPVENSGTTGRRTVKLAGGSEREDRGTELATGATPDGSAGEAPGHWEQAGRKRRIGWLGVS